MNRYLGPSLLLAGPIWDPEFRDSAILIAQHGDDGAFGWRVNGRVVMDLPELLRRADLVAKDYQPAFEQNYEIRLGGPVSQEQVWILYEGPATKVKGEIRLSETLYASASRKVLEVFITKPPEKLLGVVGYAGWAPGQLEQEIQDGSWLPSDIDSDIIFSGKRTDQMKMNSLAFSLGRTGTPALA